MITDTTVQIMQFASSTAWEQWLSGHNTTQQGIWLKIAKKTSGIKTVTYDEALQVALCFGWIDGQKKRFSEDYFIQKFTPRRSGSLWSKRNVAIVSQLIKSSRMQPAGMVEVNAAQADGRWQAAYDSPKNMLVPEDFKQAVSRNEKANSTYQTLNKANLYAIAWRLHTAKTPATRERRFAALLDMLSNGQKIHGL